MDKFEPCDILLNGAGGNYPKGTTTKEYLYPEDLTDKQEGITTFFDLDEQGIKFVFDLNFAPGFFVTKQNEALLTPRSEKILNSTPMNRFGEAEELVGVLLFLANEEASSFVNGIVIPVDGGFSAYSGV